MPSGFFYEIEGLDVEERRVATLVAGLTDLTPFWPRVVPLFIRWMASQFDTEGRWGGSPWVELTPAYAAWKALHYPGKSILQATGDLRQAASRPKRRVTPLSLELIIDDSEYTHGRSEARAVGPYHQFGGGSSEIGGTDGRPPRRKIIPDFLPPDAEADIHRVANEYVTDLARRLGLSTA